MAHTTALGRVEIRSTEGAPSRIEGLAIPYGITLDLGRGKERFAQGAFASMARAVAGGERIAYLNRHGELGGVPVAIIDKLEERGDGLYFSAEILDDVPESTQVRTHIRSGLNGVSIEFLPGLSRRQRDTVEYYSGVRLAGIAGAYAPAYNDARVTLRSATAQKGTAMALSTDALSERKGTLTAEIATIRTLAESENRALEDSETAQITALTTRIANVDALIADAAAEAERRNAERAALPATSAPIRATRQESIYGPGRGHSYFADLLVQSRDAAAASRMAQHKALIVDLADQLERRAVETSELAGAYPTIYYPDLYVPDVSYNGPFGAFFATTPITAPNPIIVPSFASATGDTAPQATQNTALSNVDIATAPKTLTPKTIGGESIVARQAVDGASPGTDVIIGNELRELLMRDTEREIALVLEALTASGTIPDTAGTGAAQSGGDLYRGITAALGKYFAGTDVGGVGARFLPAEGVFTNAVDWGNLLAGTDSTGRPLMPFMNPQNSNAQVGSGFQAGQIGGIPVVPAWAILDAKNTIIARRNDARQWKSTVLDVRLMEREGPQSVVFAVWQYFGFAVLEPKGIQKHTYTNV